MTLDLTPGRWMASRRIVFNHWKAALQAISIPTVKSNATHTVDMQALSTLSQYRTEDINPFGNYVINPDRRPEPLEQRLGLSLSPISACFGDLCILPENFPTS
jgi:hypothetical protein